MHDETTRPQKESPAANLRRTTVKRLLLAAAAALCLLHAPHAEAKYPERPITILVGFAAGGVGDVLARLAAEHAREKYGAVTSVEFKPGASATIATAQVAKSKPDGYTISLYAGSPFMTAPHLQKVPYDVAKDFTYLVTFVGVSNAVYVKKDSPFKTFADAIAFARSNPGKLRWSTAAARGTAHIATDAALRAEKVDTIMVPFNGGSEVITAVLGSHIDMGVSTDYGPQLDAGNLRLLVETGAEKVPGMPEVPTFKDLGYPIAITTTYGFFGPANLPPEVMAWWDAMIKDLMTTAAYATATKQNRLTPLYEDSATLTRNTIQGNKAFGEAIERLGLKQQ